MNFRAALPIIGFVLSSAAAAERWAVQYFYDEDRSSLSIQDLSFPSARRGVAVGVVREGEKNRPVVLVTSNGGANWSQAGLREMPLSLFFLNENLGWMVAEKGLWVTEEAGHNWRKLKAPQGILRVHFLSPEHGFAVGTRKSVYETKDGAKTWEKVAAAAQPNSNPEFTVYNWITFADNKAGAIGGYYHRPRREGDYPDWVDPESAEKRRETPALGILLDTRDGGKTWTPGTASMFGRISRLLLSPNGTGLGLIEFLNSFEYPSELFRMDWRTGKSERTYRDKNRAVTDIALTPSGTAYLAAVETQSKLRSLPIPGKLKMVRGTGLTNWREMEVDYRATARHAVLAAADDHNVWVATDTGMILKLVE